jgi:hypothetical protein
VAHDVFFQRRHKKFRHKLIIVRNSEHHNLPVLEKSWEPFSEPAFMDCFHSENYVCPVDQVGGDDGLSV